MGLTQVLKFSRSQPFIDWSALDEHEEFIEAENPRIITDENGQMSIIVDADRKIATLNAWQSSPYGGKPGDTFPHWELEGSGAKYDNLNIQ